jgi:hypothetical protein
MAGPHGRSIVALVLAACLLPCGAARASTPTQTILTGGKIS